MKGIVRFINLRNGLVSMETREGFIVFEIRQRCAIDVGDQITGSWDSPGEETLLNETKKEDFDVSIENIRCTRAEAVQSLA
jgi:hypothetical protein